MKNLFNNIRPYTEKETLVAVEKLFTNPDFIRQLSIFKDKINVDEWVKEVLACKDQFQFHLTFANRVFHYFIEKTCKKNSYSGFENINPENQYLFIGNHRDIVLDSSFLQIYFFKNGYDETRSAIGDNLLATPMFVELAKIHKMFLVLRSGTLKEKIASTHLLSSYISHSIFEEKESVWIAQGNGRTKNGDDKTQQGLIKMLTMSEPDNAMQQLKLMKITPVTISYQYEPCDQLKARELALSENSPYQKQKGEDTKSIIEGITGFKGETHFVIGKPLQQEFDLIPPELPLNDKLSFLCEQIDNQIYSNYFLYPQNYIAADIQNNSTRFSTQYSEDEKSDFVNYLNKKAIVSDVPKEKMMKNLLNIYANPVKNKLILLFCFSAFLLSSFLSLSAQNNRLTNENGQLLWQYNQNVVVDEKQNSFTVTFVFINGISQTAISLRQDLFNSQIEWIETNDIQVEKEERVSFLTVNLAPHQSVVFKYEIKTKLIDKELLLEKSAVFIMNEDFEIRKELISEQNFTKK